VIVYDTANTFLHGSAGKIQKQPYGLMRQTQIGEQLLQMSIIQTLN